jgi:hypothetical protein
MRMVICQIPINFELVEDIMTSSISDRLHTLYGLTECKINEMK